MDLSLFRLPNEGFKPEDLWGNARRVMNCGLCERQHLAVVIDGIDVIVIAPERGNQGPLPVVPHERDTDLMGAEVAKVFSERIGSASVRSSNGNVAPVIHTTHAGIRAPECAEVLHLSIHPEEGVKALVLREVRGTVHPAPVVGRNDETAIRPAE